MSKTNIYATPGLGTPTQGDAAEPADSTTPRSPESDASRGIESSRPGAVKALRLVPTPAASTRLDGAVPRAPGPVTQVYGAIDTAGLPDFSRPRSDANRPDVPEDEWPTQYYQRVEPRRTLPLDRGKTMIYPSHLNQPPAGELNGREPAYYDPARTQAFSVDELFARKRAVSEAKVAPPKPKDAAPSEEPARPATAAPAAPRDSEAADEFEKAPNPVVSRHALAAIAGLLVVGAGLLVIGRSVVEKPPSHLPRAAASAAATLAKTPASTTSVAVASKNRPAVPPIDPRSTLERAAVDATVEGRYAVAVELYRRLAESEPNRQAYREAERILSQRLRAVETHK